jgi:hypothetical protein
MFKISMRFTPLLMVLAGLLIAAAGDPARAQIAVSKDLCGPALGSASACVNGNVSALPVVAPSTAVSYIITLGNLTNQSQTVDLGETFPAGFILLTPATCDNSSILTPSSVPPLTPVFFTAVTVPASGQTICTITGYFNYLPATANNANNVVTVYPAGIHGNPIVASNNVNAVVGPPSTIPSDVSVVKTATVTASSNGTATVHYTITVTINGPNDVYGLQLQDRVTLPSTSIPLTATYVANSGSCKLVPTTSTSNCFNPVPSTNHSPVFVPSTSPVDFVEWSYPSGPDVLKSGDSMVIEYDAVIAVPTGMACQLIVGGNALINEAHIGFNIPGATTTTFESAPGNDTSTVSVPITFNAAVDPNCGKPALTMTKALAPGQLTSLTWPSSVNYVITLTNTSNLPISNIQLIDLPKSLGDFIAGGIGTPAFTAQVMSITCVPAICSGTLPTTMTPQPVTGYLNPNWMVGTNVPTLASHTSVSIQLQIQYSNPECDSYPDVTQKPVLNFVRAMYADPTLGGSNITLQSAPAIVFFAAPKPCNFKVTKAVSDGSQKIVFGQDVHYTVTYQNLSAQPATIGTMIDALRIVQPVNTNYASPLTVDYSYTCSATLGVTGFTAVNAPFPIAKSGTVQVVPTALPQQGVRIIQNLVPVVFPANSTVTCAVTVKVHQPSPGNPYCARNGELENAAIMDQSAFYDPNLPWPSNTNPGFADKVSLPLPQCFNLVVNKPVKPIWTTQNGGPLNYQLTITNVGDPIVATDGVSLTDTFAPANYVGSALVDQCLNNNTLFPDPQTPQCAFGWAPPPTSNPSTLNIQSLAHNWAANPSFQVIGPYPAPYPAVPGQVCNNAVATLTGLPTEDWYPKDPSTWAVHRCVPIFTTSDLNVVKIVQVVAPAVPPPPTSFIVDVTCSLIINGTNYAPSQTLTFNYPPSSIPSQDVANIPVGSTCSIVEHPLSTTPIPNAGCPSGHAAWGPVQYPNVLNAQQTLQSLVIGASSNGLEALNTFACVGTQTAVLKICKVAGTGVAVGTPFTFTAGSSTLTVPAGPAPGGTCVLGPSFPTGSTITVSETTPAGDTVSSIDVVPASRLVGAPNLAGGSVNVAVGSGVTEVTFTDKKTGYLEICKKGGVAGNFTVNPGNLGPFVVPAGACSPSIEVLAGSVVIHEMPTSGISMAGCATIPTNRQGPCNLGAQTSTVTVPPGDVSTTTIALITNGRSTGTLTLDKVVSAPPGGSLPNLTGVVFPVNVVCNPGPSTTVTLTAANPSQVIANIPIGSTCTITEQPLTSTGTCGRPLVSVSLPPPTYVPGQSVTIPAPPATANVTVTNVIGCVQMGSLNVEKKMTPSAAFVPIPPGVTFPVLVTCIPNGPVQTVNLTAATPNVTLPNIIAGSVCTLMELPPVGTIPPNCHWGPVTYPNGQSAMIPALSTATLAAQNTMVCTAIPPSPCVLDPGMVAAGNTFARRVTLAQTFTPTQSGTLTTITHGLETISGSVANYNLLVTTTVGGLPSWTGGSTTTPNVLLAMTGVAVFSNSAQVNGVVPIPAGQQPHLNAGTLYALILIPGAPTSGFMAWRGNSSAGSYPNGSAYELNGTTWTVPGTGPKDHGFKLDGQCP